MTVTVINRTRSEITIDTSRRLKGGKMERKPIEVQQGGRTITGCEITLPGTPLHSFTPEMTIFAKADWDKIAEGAAIKGLISLNQIEVR